MNFNPIVIGQRQKWSLMHKLGEGDAGEVYLVESLLGGQPAILKRPRKSSFYGDTLRQVAQIRTEGKILKALGSISFPNIGIKLATPELLDQSPPEEEFGGGFFIVIDRAPGVDFKSISQSIHFGMMDEMNLPDSGENLSFVKDLSEYAQLPEPILVRCLWGVIHLLETIHAAEIRDDGDKKYGLIWNDVKPEHLYWDALNDRLTVIDWGNSQFLEHDKITKDRQHSSMDDYLQFIQEMGSFIAEANPSLHAQLDWPEEVNRGNAYSAGVKPLKESLAPLCEDIVSQVQELRKKETDLYGTSRPGIQHLTRMDDLHRQMISFGMMPNISAALNFNARVALQMASENQLDGFEEVCNRAKKLTAPDSEKWELLSSLAHIAAQQENPYTNALSAGVAGDWSSMLWDLFEWIGTDPLPDWWEQISRSIRQIHLDLDADTLTPYTWACRLFYTLQGNVLQNGTSLLPVVIGAETDAARQVQRLDDLPKLFKDEVVNKWLEIEPAPPNSSIDYTGVHKMVEKIEVILPGTREASERVLTQPEAHAAAVLSAWELKDFERARRNLRPLLVWDPDRRRLLTADRAIGRAAQWLSRVRKGADSSEPFYDFLSAVELEGRELRNQVGPAKWLDMILEALKRLRKGTKSADLTIEYPEITNEIPWLNEYRSREILSLSRNRPLTLARDEPKLFSADAPIGVVEGRLGAGQDLQLGEALDVWTPEARGSSARVFAGTLRSRSGQDRSYAIKIMRPDKLEYALPLFKEEAQILSVLRDLPGITPLVECGFLRLAEGLELPGDENHTGAEHLHGQVVRYGADEVQNYLASIDRYQAQGWLPYLALVYRDDQQNLIRFCDAGFTHGWFLPLREGLLLSIQICDILQGAHERNIVYRDHKILHYYWDPETHGVCMIDWNISKRLPQGLSEAEIQFDLGQFGARALHHILTGRPAPGALPLGPNRPEDIEGASLNYNVNWTYDDERLPKPVKEILEKVLNQGYSHVKDVRADLAAVYEQIAGSDKQGDPSNSQTGDHPA